ncbi:MAG: hypothetical protein AAGC55_00570 [Myxococcota bacterium]
MSGTALLGSGPTRAVVAHDAAAIAAVLVALMLGASCKSMSSSASRPSLTVHSQSTLQADETVRDSTLGRYSIESGSNLVLAFEGVHVEQPAAYDATIKQIVIIELPAAAVRGGQFTVPDDTMRVFGRISAGDVMYLSFRAAGTVTLEAEAAASGDAPGRYKVVVDLRFEQPLVDRLNKGLTLQGTFAASVASP